MIITINSTKSSSSSLFVSQKQAQSISDMHSTALSSSSQTSLSSVLYQQSQSIIHMQSLAPIKFSLDLLECKGISMNLRRIFSSIDELNNEMKNIDITTSLTRR